MTDEKQVSRTRIKPCDCKNEYQDKTYGKGNRVFNLMKSTAGLPQYGRCTVCGSQKPV